MGSGLFQPMHLLVLLVIVILIFGPGKLGNLGKDLGKSIKDFKKAMSETDVTPPAQPQQQPAPQINKVETAPEAHKPEAAAHVVVDKEQAKS